MRLAREPHPSYLASAAEYEKDDVLVVSHVLVQIHHRIKKNIPVRGIQTTPRTNHISFKKQQIKSVRRSSTTRYPNPRVNHNLQNSRRVQARRCRDRFEG